MAGKHFKTTGPEEEPRVARTDFGQEGSGPAPASFASSQEPAPYGGRAAGPNEDEADVFSSIGVSMDSAHGDGYVRVRHRRRRRNVRALVAGGVVGALVAVVLVCSGVFAVSAYGVYTDAKAVLAEVDAFQDALTDGDAAALRESAAAIQDDAASMADAVDGPLWAVAAHLPVVGTDIANARTMVGVLQALSDDVVAPLVEQADSLDLGGIFSDGAINVELVEQLAELVCEVAPAVSEAAEQVAELDEGSIDKVNAIIERVDETMASLDALCSGLAEFAPYLSDMLGANGSRTYLILAHNTSELKSSGGFAGSVGALTITDGVLELGDFGSFTDANVGTKSDLSGRLSITDEEDALFTWSYGTEAGCSGINPDFPREAELSKEFWEKLHTGDEIAGVIALDSQVLADFLGLTGSVTMEDGTEVTAENCVELLGYGIYWEYFSSEAYTSTSNDQADALFAEVAGLAFASIMDNITDVSITGLVEVLAESTASDRLMVWMEDADEEAAIEALGASGAISDDETTAELGVYLLCRTASKLSWWTLTDTVYEKSALNGDGSTSYAVTTTVSNTITAEEVEQSSTYIHGGNDGMAFYVVYLYAPAGGTISDIQIDNGDGEVVEAEYFTIEGIEVGRLSIYLYPETTATITYTVTTSAEAETELTLRTTPTAQSAA